AHSAGVTTVLNPAPAADLPAELLGNCDVVVPNEHEAELLGGAERLLAMGCRAVVVTLGPAGVDVIGLDGRERVPAHPVDVVDTTVASAAFCGSLAARLTAADELSVAVRVAAAAGALAITVAGTVPALPTASAIRELLSAAPR